MPFYQFQDSSQYQITFPITSQNCNPHCASLYPGISVHHCFQLVDMKSLLNFALHFSSSSAKNLHAAPFDFVQSPIVVDMHCHCSLCTLSLTYGILVLFFYGTLHFPIYTSNTLASRLQVDCIHHGM